MHLLLDPGDDRPRFAEISLRVPWRMRQRHEHLPAMAAMLTNVVLHDRVPTGESVLVTKTLEDALRRVAGNTPYLETAEPGPEGKALDGVALGRFVGERRTQAHHPERQLPEHRGADRHTDDRRA